MKKATVELTYEQIKLLKTCIAIARAKMVVDEELAEIRSLLNAAQEKSTKYEEEG